MKKERENIQNMSNADLLENVIDVAKDVGADIFYEAQYDNSKEVDKNLVLLEALQKELKERLSHWLLDGKNPTWEQGL